MSVLHSIQDKLADLGYAPVIFDFDEMKKVAAWARAHKAGLHLDGARLFLESGYTGRGVKEYASLPYFRVMIP